MSEVSVVSSLIMRLIVFALSLGVAGTIIDQVFMVKGEAQKAVLHGGISYKKWNDRLIK